MAVLQRLQRAGQAAAVGNFPHRGVFTDGKRPHRQMVALRIDPRTFIAGGWSMATKPIMTCNGLLSSSFRRPPGFAGEA